jgi:hypothetical protein
MNSTQILKNSGCYENFSFEKLFSSLKKSGISDEYARSIAKKLQEKCPNEFTSKEIFKQAYKLLKKEDRILATKYSMTKAISDLGPDGYHFERFIKELFTNMGYAAKTNHFEHGRCIRHEIDVLAISEKEQIYCECKFHNNQNTKNDLKVALYVNARYRDIVENTENKITAFWLISNTKFTKDAVQYSNCAGLTLLGPNTPNESSLSNLAIKFKVFPVGSLTSLKKKDAKILIKNNTILIRDIYDSPKSLDILNIEQKTKDLILKEIKVLLGTS